MRMACDEVFWNWVRYTLNVSEWNEKFETRKKWKLKKNALNFDRCFTLWRTTKFFSFSFHSLGLEIFKVIFELNLVVGLVVQFKYDWRSAHDLVVGLEILNEVHAEWLEIRQTQHLEFAVRPLNHDLRHVWRVERYCFHLFTGLHLKIKIK